MFSQGFLATIGTMFILSLAFLVQSSQQSDGESAVRPVVIIYDNPVAESVPIPSPTQQPTTIEKWTPEPTPISTPQPSSRVVRLSAYANYQSEGTIGSGVLLNENGDILTAYHVYDQMHKLLNETEHWMIETEYNEIYNTRFRCDIKIPSLDVCVIQKTPLKRPVIKTTAHQENVTLKASIPEFDFFQESIQFHTQVGAEASEGDEFLWLLNDYSKFKMDQYIAYFRDWGGASGGGVYTDEDDLAGMIVATNAEKQYIVPATAIAKALRAKGVSIK